MQIQIFRGERSRYELVGEMSEDGKVWLGRMASYSLAGEVDEEGKIWHGDKSKYRLAGELGPEGEVYRGAANRYDRVGTVERDGKVWFGDPRECRLAGQTDPASVEAGAALLLLLDVREPRSSSNLVAPAVGAAVTTRIHKGLSERTARSSRQQEADPRIARAKSMAVLSAFLVVAAVCGLIMLAMNLDPLAFGFGLLPVVAAPAALLVLLIGYGAYRATLGVWLSLEMAGTPEERSNRRRVLLVVGLVASGIATAGTLAVIGAGSGSASRTSFDGESLTGSQVEDELKRRVTGQDGSGVLMSTLECPAKDKVMPNDSIRCEVERNGAVMGLIIDVTKIGSQWNFEVSLEGE